MKRLLVFFLCGLVLAAVLGETGDASQVIGAKLILTGTVYDPNHAVIISSQIVAQDFAGQEYSALTSDEGVYKFELPFATYKIEATAPGFCPRRVDVIRVRSSLRSRLDFVLDIEHGDRPCAQKTMIKKAQPTRKPNVFWSIAE